MGLRDLLVGVGFLLLFEGLPLFAAPGLYRRVARQIDRVPEGFLRLGGLAAAGSGLMILYAVFLMPVD